MDLDLIAYLDREMEKYLHEQEVADSAYHALAEVKELILEAARQNESKNLDTVDKRDTASDSKDSEMGVRELSAEPSDSVKRFVRSFDSENPVVTELKRRNIFK